TSARPGDEAILAADGAVEGFVGGQCAQNSVRKAALGALQTGQSVLLRVLPDGDVHFPEAPGASVVVNPCLSGGALEIFLDPQVPAPLIRICGATPIAEKLAEVCAVLGFDVRRDGPGPGSGDPGPVTAVVIATHGGPEAELIRSALDAGVGYIGLVASKVRGAAVLDGLALTDEERRRIYTPVGLPIGAKTPAEIAVSVVAEIIREIRLGGLVDTDSTSHPPEDIDPVCGMTVTVGPDTEHVQVDGTDYWFCSAGCRASFTAAKAGA
ncbi:MAG: XdhC family protein, partial [Mycolicibacterium sp.]|nr:XdhC family protein [Mycolicibacterium sp.]